MAYGMLFADSNPATPAPVGNIAQAPLTNEEVLQMGREAFYALKGSKEVTSDLAYKGLQAQSRLERLKGTPDQEREAKQLYEWIGTITYRYDQKEKKKAQEEAKKQEILSAGSRRGIGDRVENLLVSSGYEVDVSVGGTHNTRMTVRFKYTTVGKVLAQQLSDAGLVQTVQDAGFHKLTLVDSYGNARYWEF